VVDEHLGDAEVGELRMACHEEHVLRLEVAMHDGAAVRIAERIGDLAQDPQRLVDRQLAVAHESDAQRAALHVRHHVIQELAGFAGVDPEAGRTVWIPTEEMEIADDQPK
jgi:hypothetical protein